METENCFYCGEVFPTEDLRSVDSHLICEDCQDNILSCSRCGVNFLSDNNAGTDAHPLCVECRETFYTFCSRCDSLITLDDAYYLGSDDNSPYCSYCYSVEERQREEEEQYIHEYSYKPKTSFFGEGPRYLGVELEICHAGFNQKNAKKLLDIANKDHDFLYCKSDSSIDNGFELVTEALSLDVHMNIMPWKEVLEEAIKMGYFSYKGNNGYHIHVSRLGLGQTIAAQDAAISRILFFFEKNWDQILNFSRRSKSEIDRWARRYGFKNTPRDTIEGAKESENGRYCSINILPPFTFEFRVFRGSLRLNTVLAALQFVDAICDAAISLTDLEMQALSWQQFVKDLDLKKRKELIEYLKIRQLYVNDAVQVEEDL
jgi:hypothetical protein